MIINKLVEIWRAPVVEDALGYHSDWDNPVRIASVPASFQPYRPLTWSHETIGDRDTTNTRYKLYIFRILDVEPTDRVLIDGEWWEIDGDAGVYDVPLKAANTKLDIRRFIG